MGEHSKLLLALQTRIFDAIEKTLAEHTSGGFVAPIAVTAAGQALIKLALLGKFPPARLKETFDDLQRIYTQVWDSQHAKPGRVVD